MKQPLAIWLMRFSFACVQIFLYSRCTKHTWSWSSQIAILLGDFDVVTKGSSHGFEDVLLKCEIVLELLRGMSWWMPEPKTSSSLLRQLGVFWTSEAPKDSTFYNVWTAALQNIPRSVVVWASEVPPYLRAYFACLFRQSGPPMRRLQSVGAKPHVCGAWTELWKRTITAWQSWRHGLPPQHC